MTLIRHRLCQFDSDRPTASPVPITVELFPNGVWLRVPLSGIVEGGADSARVLLELSEHGSFRVLVWPDGNSEDPITHQLTPYTGPDHTPT